MEKSFNAQFYVIGSTDKEIEEIFLYPSTYELKVGESVNIYEIVNKLKITFENAPSERFYNDEAVDKIRDITEDFYIDTEGNSGKDIVVKNGQSITGVANGSGAKIQFSLKNDRISDSVEVSVEGGQSKVTGIKIYPDEIDLKVGESISPYEMVTKIKVEYNDDYWETYNGSNAQDKLKEITHSVSLDEKDERGKKIIYFDSKNINGIREGNDAQVYFEVMDRNLVEGIDINVFDDPSEKEWAYRGVFDDYTQGCNPSKGWGAIIFKDINIEEGESFENIDIESEDGDRYRGRIYIGNRSDEGYVMFELDRLDPDLEYRIFIPKGAIETDEYICSKNIYYDDFDIHQPRD